MDVGALFGLSVLLSFCAFGIVTILVLSYLMVLESPRIVDAFVALFPERRAERIRRVGQSLVTATSAEALPTAPDQLIEVSPGMARAA